MNLFKKINEKKIIFFKFENFYYLIFIIIIFFTDRISKVKIINLLNENTYYVNDYINFDLIC